MPCVSAWHTGLEYFWTSWQHDANISYKKHQVLGIISQLKQLQSHIESSSHFSFIQKFQFSWTAVLQRSPHTTLEFNTLGVSWFIIGVLHTVQITHQFFCDVAQFTCT